MNEIAIMFYLLAAFALGFLMWALFGSMLGRPAVNHNVAGKDCEHKPIYKHSYSTR